MKTTKSCKRRNWIAAALAGLCLWLGAGTAAWAATRTWTGAAGDGKASTGGNWSPSGAPTNTDDIVLDGTSMSNLTWDAAATNTVASWTQTAAYTGTVTIATVYSGKGTFTNLTITGDCTISNGVWTHLDNSTTESNKLDLTVNGNMIIASNVVLSVDGLGYDVGYGPGAPGGAHGGSYGGIGGWHAGTPNSALGNTYGSIIAPTNIGSGGGNNGGISGGGAIRLTVTGALTLDGTISANGQAGNRTGAGGSIYVQAGTIGGSSGGLIRANGGTGLEAGGAGGRVAVVLSGGDFSAFGGRMTAYGAKGGGLYYPGAAGTVYRQTSSQATGQGVLVIDNDNGVPCATVDTRLSPSVNLNDFAAVIITNKGNIGVAADTTLNLGTARIAAAGAANAFITVVNPALMTFPDPYVISNYTLVADTALSVVTGNWTVATNGALTHRDNSWGAETYKLDLTIDGDLTVAAGGAVAVDGRGYDAASGPGAPPASPHGGSHGGVGGVHAHVPAPNPGVTYGSIIAPTNIGSGAGSNGGNSGGGAVRLNVLGALTVHGTISANGQAGNRTGAGGSVYLQAQTMSGSGVISANGGTPGESGGGGGRIAVVLSAGDFSGFSGSMSAIGGNGSLSQSDGTGGTIFQQSPIGTALRVANFAGASLDPRVATDIKNPAGLSAATLTITNSILALATNVQFASLALQSANSCLQLAGYTGTVSTLTITNQVFKNGVYAAADLGPLVSDSSPGGVGRVVVYKRSPGTMVIVR